MKECGRCKRALPFDAFGKNASRLDGLTNYCSECKREYERNMPVRPTRPRGKDYARKYRYGISQEQYEAMLVSQNNACAVCKEEFGGKVRPNVDHDHNCCPGMKTCGKCVRGILCHGCNAFAGLIETRLAHHDTMFTYLHLHLKARESRMGWTEQYRLNVENTMEV